MVDSISADLKHTQQCKATEMIKFLLAFCQSGNEKTVPVHHEDVLQRAFEKTRELANSNGTPLQTRLLEL